MGITRGPNIVRDGLIMGYDTGYYPGIRKSYKGRYYGGQPTVNLVGTQTKTFSNWSGLTGTTDYYTTEEGNQGIKLQTQSSGGVQWYSCTQMQNILPSTSYTISATVRYQDGDTPHVNLFYVRQYNSSGNQTSEGGKFSTSYLEDLGNGWKRAYRTFTTDSACDRITLQGYEYTVGRVIYMQDIQFEQRSHHTPFAGASITRTSTESIVDLAKQRTFDVSTASFNSSANLIFDGTDDYINLGNYAPLKMGYNFSLEFVVKPELDKWMYFFHKGYGGNNALAWGRHSSSDDWFFSTYISGGYQNTYMGTATVDEYCHLVATYDGANLKFYENGILKATVGTTHQMMDTNTSAGIGGPDRYWNGEIPVAKVYNKVLSTEEVVSNFNAYKNRFNI